jgi:site-specific recombinase XerD
MTKTQQKRFQVLYQKHISALKRQGKSDTTIDSYARAVRRISERFDCCPDKLTLDQIKSHFDQLIDTHSWSTVKVDRNGLQFFYEHVLGKPWQWINIVKPPEVKTLPDILSHQEINRIFNAINDPRYQAYFFTVYSMGLRLGEALGLSVKDIDAEQHRVHIRLGKGRKDRYVALPDKTLNVLRTYWVSHRHKRLLFPAGKTAEERHRATHAMDRGGLQKAFRAIVSDCGIHKNITIHSLRHCYGAHLVEAGLNLRAIQELMGHEDPKTTALYTQLTETTQQNTQSIINQLINGLSFQHVKE